MEENKNENLLNEEKKDKELIENLNQEDKFPWIFTIISVFLLGVAAIVIYLAVAPSKAGEGIWSNDKETASQEENLAKQEENKEDYYSPYKIVSLYEGKSWLGDSQVVDEKNNVVIESLNKVFPILKKDPNQYVEILAVPQNTSYIIFEIRVGEANGLLYKYNLDNKVLSRLDANKIYTNHISVNILSPDQKHLIFAPIEDYDGKEQTIYVIDLITGLNKEYKLEGNETYNAGFPYKNSFVRIEWLNNKEFKVAVFDQSKKMKRPKIFTNLYQPNKEELDKIYLEEKTFSIEK